MPVFSIVGGPNASQGANGGKVYGFNALNTTTPTQILPANPNRVSITFHTVGGQDVLVYPQTTGTGAPNTPTITFPGGGFRVFGNGGILTITGECQQAWSALAFVGTTQSLTVMESNVA